MKDVKKKNNNSIIPLILMVAVLGGVVGGGYYLYNSAKSGNTNVNRANTNTNTARSPQVPPNAPQGANPPHMLGSPTASVTVEEFADFQCSACAQVHPMVKEIQSIYGSKIKLLFRNYPLTMHDKAYDAAIAAEAAGLQGKFWAMQDQLFNNQQAWSSPSANHKQLWTEYAQKIGLDMEKWQTDVAGMAAKSRVDLDMGRARALNVSATPTLYVNNKPVDFADLNVAALRRIIDTELQNAPAPTAAIPPTNAARANSSAPNTNTNRSR